MNIQGKVALVTGSGGLGSGRAEALRLAREGASVVVSDIHEAGGLETVHMIRADGGRAAFCRADMASDAAVSALVDYAVSTFGGVDILVNNASAPYRPTEPLDWWFQPVAVDLLGAMSAIRYCIPIMRSRGGGAIVNIGSTSALGHGRKHSGSPTYDVAKAAVTRLTTTLGWLGEKDNIRVNCLVPDWVAVPEVLEYWNALSPAQRRQQDVPEVLTTLDEVCDAVVELITADHLAGRVMVWWSGRPRQLIVAGDPGYAGLE
ncbi:MAG TPA: SDR family NAD(P)-dependent oxidoreductase [Pirellulales bacterium]|jgi:NAD(P)-dependent dehydrogenase (short-subunit alcohol dehydrogenase family)